MLNQVTCDALYYSDGLVKHYQTLSALPGFVLLESRDRLHGRYDIVSAYPYERVVIPRDTTDLAASLRQFQDKLQSLTTTSACALPFQGGAIGYIAYDLGAKLMGLNAPTHPILDNMPLLDMGFYDWAIVVDHVEQSVTLISANQQSETMQLVKEIRVRWDSVSLFSSAFVLHRPFAPVISQMDYHAAFASIHADLIRGRAYQVNYTQPFIADSSGDPWGMYCTVCEHNPVPYGAFMRCQDFDILSFSSERFLTYDNNKMLTSPIKGTARRSADLVVDTQLQNWLLSCPKNRAENVMIVDLLRNDLGKIARPGSVNVTSLCALQSYTAVHHLVSDIEAECKDGITAWDAFMACFPGGSITGAPKREAMRIIYEQEQMARGVYCGHIGYFSAHGRCDMNIAIRTVVARHGCLYLGVGGGIVIDSQWQDEYKECLTKIQAITGAFLV